MAKDFAAQLELLRELYERVRAKEEIAPEVIAAAGMKGKPRLKDIEKQISAVRKQISHSIKEEVRKEEEAEIERLKEMTDMTEEEIRENLGKAETVLDVSTVDRKAKDMKDRAITKARNKKESARVEALGEEDVADVGYAGEAMEDM